MMMNNQKHTFIRVLVISHIYQEKERFLSVINFSSRSERNLEEGNQLIYTLMALTGIMMHNVNMVV